jgi:hypothetical protein
MNRNNIFTAYNETLISDYLLMAFNGINYFFNIFFLAFILMIALGAIGYTKKTFIKTEILTDSKYGIYYFSFILATIITILNKQYNIYFDMLTYSITIFLVTVIGFFNIEKKSLKWFTVLLTIFLSIVSVIYVGALELIAKINMTGLDHFGIINYEIFHKSLFKIYELKDSLFTIKYSIDGKNILVDNSIIYKRIYIFYYFMNTIALAFWFYVYHRVLKFHGVKLFKNMP